MDVPDLGGSGLGLGTLLLIAAAVLLGVPLLNSVMESKERREQEIQPLPLRPSRQR